jgi:hypothetical protein
MHSGAPLRGEVTEERKVLIDRTSPTLSREFCRLLDLLLMGFVQDRAEELLDPHRHLPAYPLVHLGGAVPLSRGP